MCGIVGVYHHAREASADTGQVKQMADWLVHRGPDDGGVLGMGPVALGHRRLSILDLSEAGHQPMVWQGRYAITFNGEIYNYLELRSELEARGVRFRTRSDTEVLLALYATNGVACLERLNGMFAFAIYDRIAHRLFLARDRFGKKPLYLWEADGKVSFASELKAFRADPLFSPEIEPTAVRDYLSLLYIPDPKTIYRGVTRLPPAHALVLEGRAKRMFRYWQVPVPPLADDWREDRPGLEAAVDAVAASVTEAVRLRTVSDVPLGAFLSGGVDSGLVVAELSRLSSLPVRTSTIRFRSADYDESPYAADAAACFGCDHEAELVEADAASMLETLLWHFDEPFGDSSALPTYYLCRSARRRVTVALSGDGGDEAFAGYDKFAVQLWESRIRNTLPAFLWRGLASLCSSGGPRPLRSRLAEGLQLLSEPEGEACYRAQSFTRPEWVESLMGPVLKEGVDRYSPRAAMRDALERGSPTDLLSALQRVDFAFGLPGDMLVKVDRMSMAHSLEVRCPLLDQGVVSLAMSMPSSFRMYRREGKRVLKRALERYLPREHVSRPKHGFTVPMAEWCRGSLRSLIEEQLFSPAFLQAGWLSEGGLRRVLRAHLTHEADFGMTLWTCLVLSVWHAQIHRRSSPRSIAGAAPTRVDDISA